MKETEKLKQSRAIYIVSLVLLIILTAWIIKPFILTIIGGLILGYIFYPVYLWVLKRMKNKWASAFIVSTLIILIFTIPIVLSIQLFAKEAYVSYILIKQKLASGGEFKGECLEATLKCDAVRWVGNFLSNSQVNFYINDALNKATQFFIDKSREFITSLPQILIDLLILIFVIFYTFKDGEKFLKKVESVIPLRMDHKIIIKDKAKEMLNSTLYGIIVVSIIQGIIAGIGYFIFGVKSPVLLGIFTALAAMIPVIGTGIVWFPVSLSMLVNGLIENQNSLIFRGIGLMIYGFFIVSLIDNFIRPKIIGKRAKLHPILVLLGILGGVAAFGVVGILIGPLVIALFVTFLEIVYLGEHEAKS